MPKMPAFTVPLLMITCAAVSFEPSAERHPPTMSRPVPSWPTENVPPSGWSMTSVPSATVAEWKPVVGPMPRASMSSTAAAF